MNKDIINEVFAGYVQDEALFNTINEYINLVENNKNENNSFKTNLLICAENEDNGLIFASKLAKIFKNNNLAKSFSCVNSDEDILYLDDVTVVDDFIGDVNKNTLDKINDSSSIVLLFTNKDKLVEYKKNSELYYKTFSKEVILKEYDIKDIIGGCHFLLEKLRNENKIEYDDSLYIELDKYINTVYPRAILKGEAFVLDLIDRLTKNSYKSEKPNVFTLDCIPFYHEQGLYEECKSDLENSFIYCDQIENILLEVNDEKKVKDLNLDTIKANFNLCLKSNDYKDALSFSRLYASLLYSKELNIVNSKQVKELDEDELVNTNLDDVHGVILLKDVKDESTVAKLIDRHNDIVFVLYANNELQNELKYLFKYKHDLDSHNLDTSRKYVENFYRSKGIEADDIEDVIEAVNKSSNIKEAKAIVEKDIVKRVTSEVISEKPDVKKEDVKQEVNFNDFDEVLKKEKELADTFNGIKDDSNEKNVVLLAMSTLTRISVSGYICKEDETIKGKYVSQLEPTVKALAEKLGRENKVIDSIYSVNTLATINDKVRTDFNNEKVEKEYIAFEYFKERCKGFTRNIEGITLNDGDTGSAVYEFVNRINNDKVKTNLYIVINGGPRDTFAAIDAPMMLVKEMDNIELKDILNVRFKDKEPTIVLSALNEYGVFDFVSGMKEFLSFGRSNGLVEFNNKNEKPNEELVKAINGISDSISLSQMDDFEERLKNINSVIDKTTGENGYYDTVQSLIRRNYIVNYGGQDVDMLEHPDDLLAQIKWCLDKNLLTQALVLVETKSAVYMNKHGLLQFKKQENNSYKVSDYLNDIVINSICNPESAIYIAYGNDSDKEIANDVNIGYFRTYVKDFNGIKTNDFDDAIRQIKNLEKGLTLIQAQKFYEVYNYIPRNSEYYCTVYKKNKVGTRYYCESKVLPIKETKLLNREDFVEDYYICLYLFKSLKSFRNAVAHALDYEKRVQYSANEIKFWVQLYMEQLNKLVHYKENYLDKPIIEKKAEIVEEKKEYDDPDAEANLESLKKLQERFKR